MKFFSLILVLGLASPAIAGEKAHMKTDFDFIEYGRIEKGEIKLEMHLSERRVPPEFKIPGQANTDQFVVYLKVDILNVSKREIHFYEPMWFTSLKVKVNGLDVPYTGPLASMPPPRKDDFSTIPPGGKASLESRINSVFKISSQSGTKVEVRYSHSAASATATLIVK